MCMKPLAYRWVGLDSRPRQPGDKDKIAGIPRAAHRLTTVPNSQPYAPVDPDIKLTTLASCAG